MLQIMATPVKRYIDPRQLTQMATHIGVTQPVNVITEVKPSLNRALILMRRTGSDQSFRVSHTLKTGRGLNVWERKILEGKLHLKNRHLKNNEAFKIRRTLFHFILND